MTSIYACVLSILGLMLVQCKFNNSPTKGTSSLIKPTLAVKRGLEADKDKHKCVFVKKVCNRLHLDFEVDQSISIPKTVIEAVGILKKTLVAFNKSFKENYDTFEQGANNSAYFNSQITFVHGKFTNDFSKDKDNIYAALGYDVNAIRNLQTIVNALAGANASEQDIMSAENLLDFLRDTTQFVLTVVDENEGDLSDLNLYILRQRSNLRTIKYLKKCLDGLLARRIEVIGDVKQMLASAVEKLGNNEAIRSELEKIVSSKSGSIYHKIYSTKKSDLDNDESLLGFANLISKRIDIINSSSRYGRKRRIA
ncbi:CRASP family complement regulator-acquiring lipoprotein [Candidatus Borrelia fainii]|nr:CRASP family complement regulator-acquiring lipoprotein [Candidatus Borrelia fainii]